MKDKESILKEIFENDPFGLLTVKPKKSAVRTSDERLAASFDQINDFIKKNGREPNPDPTNISEYKLYSTLKGLRENEEKTIALESQDIHGLLDTDKKEINSLDDILGDDSLNILGDDSDVLFTFKHTPKDFERAKADFIGKRFKCKDFHKYEQQFKDVQDDLALGKRKLIDFKLSDLKQGNYYVHNGILFLLENIYDRDDKIDLKDTHKDGRTRCVFENGTESNILYRTVGKNLANNGKMVTQNVDRVNEEFTESFSEITKNDKETGYIYVLTSQSEKEEIASIRNLYKIGYTSKSVEERVRNAENDPTYLMSKVKIESSWKCYNMKAQKFEALIHKFFGHCCLEVEVNDDDGNVHSPREWFIVPIEAIEKAISLIISGEILNYYFDNEKKAIVQKT